MADGTFDKLTVTDSIGIGTETPNAQLHIAANAAEGKVLVGSSSNLFKLSVDGTGATLGTVNAIPFSLQTEGSSRLTIDAFGKVGINQSTPNFRLDVNGGINATDYYKNGVPWKLGTNDILDNAITADKIVDNAIVASKIPDGSISAVKLAPGTLPNNPWVSSAAGQIAYNGGNVGISTAPAKAKLEIAGAVGSTIGLFGSDRQGIALVANWPSVGFNAYFNNGWKAIAPGWTGNVYVNQDVGGIAFQIGQKSTVANAAVTFIDRFFVGADGVVSIPGRLNFGAQVRQMINLWNTEYGIGVQSGTQYFRSGADFCWFRGGIHHDSQHNPGGGVRLMTLNWWGDLILSGRTNPEGSPNKPLCRALVDAGKKLTINHEGDFVDGVDIFKGRFVSSRQYKTNIVALSSEEATQALQDLNPVKFNYRNDADGDLQLGFIAEDVPDLVATADRTAIGALDIVAVLTKVVQEQQAAIVALTNRIKTLEQQMV